MIASYMKTSVTSVILRLSGRAVPALNELDDAPLEIADLGEDAGGNMLIRGPLTSLQRLAQTASLGAPDCYPIAAFAQIFDDEFFGDYSIPKDLYVIASDPKIARIGAYLSIGELFTYLNEERNSAPSPLIGLYSRTFAYAFARSNLLWGAKRSRHIFERWTLLRNRLGLSPTKTLSPKLVASVIEPWLRDRRDIPWMGEVEGALANNSDLLTVLPSYISDRLEVNLPLPPNSFDQRFEWLGNVAIQFRECKVDPTMGALALGLLVAAVEPGELMHLNWLRLHLKTFPQVAICYAGWSAILSGNRQDKPPVLRGLVRRLERDLQRPLDLKQAPLEDASLIDILASSKPLDDIQLRANPKSFNISIVPGVIFNGGYAYSNDHTRAPQTHSSIEPQDNRQHSIFSGDDLEFRRTVLRELEEMRRLLFDMNVSKRKAIKKV